MLIRVCSVSGHLYCNKMQLFMCQTVTISKRQQLNKQGKDEKERKPGRLRLSPPNGCQLHLSWEAAAVPPQTAAFLHDVGRAFPSPGFVPETAASFPTGVPSAPHSATRCSCRAPREALHLKDLFPFSVKHKENIYEKSCGFQAGTIRVVIIYPFIPTASGTGLPNNNNINHNNNNFPSNWICCFLIILVTLQPVSMRR